MPDAAANFIQSFPACVAEKSYYCGKVFHQVMPSRRTDGITENMVNPTPRRVVYSYVIPDAETLGVTESRTCPQVNQCNGLFWQGDKKSKWLHHDGLDAFESAWEAGQQNEYVNQIRRSWFDGFFYRESRSIDGNESPGLRPPQLGSLHALMASFKSGEKLSTVVLPTGTGKTECMLSALVAGEFERLLVIVPSRSLKTQTFKKFLGLGLLPALGLVSSNVKTPVVGVIEKRPRGVADLEMLRHCNVVVANIGSITGGTATSLGSPMSSMFSHLFLDEAHHVAANSWKEFREHFLQANKPVVQFTATPFREDDRVIDGRVIYSYPLADAQQDGYFKPIRFEGVFETDRDRGDAAIARRAIARLRADLRADHDHILMVRAGNKSRAENLFSLYQGMAADLFPQLVHSEVKDVDGRIREIIRGNHRIVVAVNMLSEGFDLPQLKIAALHDRHKSLTVTLQFIGRFTRSAGASLGGATVIANTGDDSVTDSLQRLYEEDSDWDEVVSNLSFDRVEQQRTLLDFLRNMDPLETPSQNADSLKISISSIRPKESCIVYSATMFTPEQFYRGVEKPHQIHQAWLANDRSTLVFTTYVQQSPQWTNTGTLKDDQWHVFILHFDDQKQLLYLHTSEKGRLHFPLALAVTNGTAQSFSSSEIFRCLGRMNRLLFTQVGLMKAGRRNLRYTMYTGADVEQALTPEIRQNSTQSNVFGSGFENGQPTSYGASAKGKIWSRGQGSLAALVDWMKTTGEKLLDTSINTEVIIDNVLIPTRVDTFPEARLILAEWPDELLRKVQDTVSIIQGDLEVKIWETEFEVPTVNTEKDTVQIRLKTAEIVIPLILKIEGQNGFEFTCSSNSDVDLRVGSRRRRLVDYLNDYPLVLRYVTGAELHGCEYIEVTYQQERLADDDLVKLDWTGIDIKKESIYKSGVRRSDCVQQKALDRCRQEGFTLIFNDDDAGEVADLVALREDTDAIILRFLHCKFSHGTDPGERIADAVEVSSQAIRSVRHTWDLQKLAKELSRRESKWRGTGRSRYEEGSSADLRDLAALSKYKPLQKEILVVQPGIQKAAVTDAQSTILNNAKSYIKETCEAEFKVWCS